jgi:hypothetical protein
LEPNLGHELHPPVFDVSSGGSWSRISEKADFLWHMGKGFIKKRNGYNQQRVMSNAATVVDFANAFGAVADDPVMPTPSNSPHPVRSVVSLLQRYCEPSRAPIPRRLVAAWLVEKLCDEDDDNNEFLIDAPYSR